MFSASNPTERALMRCLWESSSYQDFKRQLRVQRDALALTSVQEQRNQSEARLLREGFLRGRRFLNVKTHNGESQDSVVLLKLLGKAPELHLHFSEAFTPSSGLGELIVCIPPPAKKELLQRLSCTRETKVMPCKALPMLVAEEEAVELQEELLNAQTTPMEADEVQLEQDRRDPDDLRGRIDLQPAESLRLPQLVEAQEDQRGREEGSDDAGLSAKMEGSTSAPKYPETFNGQVPPADAAVQSQESFRSSGDAGESMAPVEADGTSGQGGPGESQTEGERHFGEQSQKEEERQGEKEVEKEGGMEGGMEGEKGEGESGEK
eukprot:scaffold3069_cov292-Pinguiococcus_pyrenoidosus.AAC.2